MADSLLINWAYYHPSGHVLEALQHAYGFHPANREVDISLLLNADSALSLTAGCPWLAAAGARLLLRPDFAFADACA